MLFILEILKKRGVEMMTEIENKKLMVLQIFALSGIFAAIFYIGHVIGGRMETARA